MSDDENTVGNDGLSWPQTFDGMAWAIEFNKRFPSVAVDDALGWMCNAIMRGWDAHAQKLPPVDAAPVAWALQHDVNDARPWMDITSHPDTAEKWKRYYPGRVIPLYSHPPRVRAVEECPASFVEYVQTNYPPMTVISAPEWHAPKLWQAAMHALRATTPTPEDA